ncbi:MAG TPA: S8 family peptidase [Wenzhouxiangella sp.]|nr:S8 family peptidase [Wenzhouxiangella sp.]
MLNRLLPMRLAGACLLAITFLSTASAAEFFTTERPVENQYIVVLKDKALTAEKAKSAKDVSVAAIARNIVSKNNAKLVRSYESVLPGFVVRADKKTLVRLLDDDRIDYIEEDGIVSVNAVQNNPTWGLDRIDQRNLPLDNRYTYNTTASNVHAYIIDTGVLGSHSEFSGRMGNGYSAINDGRGPSDCNGHGTHVAGTVAGSTYGVAKGATVHGVRVLGCDGRGTNSGIIAGMDWVAQNAQFPAVANMSLGGGASQAIDSAVTRMRNAGVTVVVAAGNETQNACNVSPARSSSAITVGSTTSNDQRSSFSNWGTCVDIFAPGSNVTSAWHTGTNATNTISGTSMASPHVAGVAALYLATNPNASPAQVANAILSSGTSGVVGNPGTGSPNLLVYSLLDGNGDDDDDNGDDDDGDDGDNGEVVELTNGVPKTGLSGGQNSERFFVIDVPANARNLEISMSGGSGDADLYVRIGSKPTTSAYDCRPWRNGNNESCVASSPQAGSYYIMVRGYSSYSGVSLVASYESGGGGGAPCTSCTRFSGSLNSGGASIEPNGNYYYAATGYHKGWLQGPASADFDLDLFRWNGFDWQRVAVSQQPGSQEHINHFGLAGYYLWQVRSYYGSGSYNLWIDTP